MTEEFQARSLAEIPEAELARLLYDDLMFREKILPHDCGEHWAMFEVEYAELLKEPRTQGGEIDLIVIPTQSAPLAIAIEFKRVKVTASTFRTGQANKLQEIPKLANQANRLVELGFHRVCASIFVLVDARGTEGDYRWFLESPEEVRSGIRDLVAESGFSRAVNVDLLEIRQPFDVDFRLRGSTTRTALQEGENQAQAPGLTHKLETLFAFTK